MTNHIHDGTHCTKLCYDRIQDGGLPVAFKSKQRAATVALSFSTDHALAVMGGDTTETQLAWMELLANLQQSINAGEDVWLRIGPDKGRTTILVTRYLGRSAEGYASGTTWDELSHNLSDL